MATGSSKVLEVSQALAVWLVLALTTAEAGPGVLLGYFGSMAPLILLHEVAHAVAGASTGQAPAVIRLFGPRPRFIFDVGPSLVTVGWNPVRGGGTVLGTPHGRWRRPRRAFALLAGPVSSGLVVVLLVGGGHGLTAFAVGAAVMAAQLCVFNLIPQRVQTPFGLQASDGSLLLQLLRREEDPDPEVARLWLEAYRSSVRGAHDRVAADAARGAELTDEPALLRDFGHMLLGAGRPVDAAIVFRRSLQRAREAGWTLSERAIVANGLAWADLMIGSDDLLDEADQHSDDAVATDPESPAFADTAGWVALRRHRFAVAHELFLRAATAKTPGSDVAITARGAALAAAGLGDAELAAAWGVVATRYAHGVPVKAPPVEPLRTVPDAHWSRSAVDEAVLAGRFRGVIGPNRELFFMAKRAVLLVALALAVGTVIMALVAALLTR